MTATDELRKLLDERGVEYKETTSGNTTIFDFDYCEQCDDYLHTIAITGACISAYLDYLEPKQAIAATLGGDDGYEAKMDELLCRLTNGKWSKSRAYSIEFMVSCIDEEYEELYEKERAELGSERGTCHAESDLSEWVCSECQCWIPLGLTPENIRHASEWRYCPHCGAKVEVG